jgi:hypothetical protein
MFQTWWCDVQRRDIRGSIQMVLTPYDLFSWNKRSINFNFSNITSNYIVTKSFLEDAHSVHAGSSSSRPTHPSFFFLLHDASFLAGSWLLIFLPAWGAQPSLTPFPWADPSSLRSQATPHSHVGHTTVLCSYISYMLSVRKSIRLPIAFVHWSGHRRIARGGRW